MRNVVAIDSSQTFYFLKGDTPSSPFFKRYQQLMIACEGMGEFLSFTTTPEWLSCYERDAQSRYAKLPLVVFRPHKTAHIAPFIQHCHQLDLPFTTRCGGTGLVGSCVAHSEGMILLTQHLKQIKSYDAKKGLICLEPGVTVRQVNDHVSADQWRFPLKMASDGVAGIAGCLSSHARGYHQQQQAFYDAIERVTLVDGEGKIREVPSSLVCGAEGLWGVIIEIRMRLKRRPSQQQEFVYLGSWQELLIRLPLLRSLQPLIFLTWTRDRFYLGLEGEDWRLRAAIKYLNENLQGIQPIDNSFEELNRLFLPSQKQFVILSSVFHPSKLLEAYQWSKTEASSLGLESLQQIDVLAGSLHLILQSQEEAYSFQQKVDDFLVRWANEVDQKGGIIASCHGIGIQMRPYMTPFWTEETEQILRELQSLFDPRGLFRKGHFFPDEGNSLEKRGAE